MEVISTLEELNKHFTTMQSRPAWERYDALENILNLPQWKPYFPDMEPLDISFCGDDPPLALSPAHENSLSFLLTHGAQMLDSILTRLLAEYPQLQEDFGYSEEEKGEYMPDVTTKEELCKLLTPCRIQLIPIEKDGLSYMGVAFDCTWDEEHALGVMMHKTRVVDMGGEDTSFLSWIAKRDLEKEST